MFEFLLKLFPKRFFSIILFRCYIGERFYNYIIHFDNRFNLNGLNAEIFFHRVYIA